MAMSKLPAIPVPIGDFLSYVHENREVPVTQSMEPFKNYEQVLRGLYAQEPASRLLDDPHVNTVPLFDEDMPSLRIRARDIAGESEEDKSKYLLSLNDKDRKSDGAPAIVSSLEDFQHNFGIFTEQSLSELDWNNVVAAGSSALTPLLPISGDHGMSKRSIRNYYNQIVAPASDVDLFLYGLSEADALEKIIHIERAIQDSILSETTTIRTKNAITIASKYPVRHVQIVLRIYKSVSEILTGFDVDCSCVAYDGQQVYATPRAIAALQTQVNRIDLSRRSPSYEARLSKYSQRGFEVYWPDLDRTRIDPTIYERSFPRTVGLARLLVLEKLPKDVDRYNYNNQRRQERGRPANNYNHRRRLGGNVKESNVDDIADWQEDDQISNYHSFSIPYGPRFAAKKIEKMLYTKDLLLNAEWNIKDRNVNLHRHPAFIGDAEYVLEDCCGHCPSPQNEEEHLIAEEEARHYVSGRVTFITDNPGRQTIGSFNPIVADDWTDMAYVGDTGLICQAIIDNDVKKVETLLQQGVDVNRRDYTGRTLLHLATTSSSVDVVRCLLKHGAYLIPRIADGQTALHLAAVRGDIDILQALLRKSQENANAVPVVSDEVPSRGQQDDKDAQSHAKSREDEEIEVIESDGDSIAESEISAAGSGISSFLKVEGIDRYMEAVSKEDKKVSVEDSAGATSTIEPKDDILDVNAIAWDTGCAASHLATIFGNVEALRTLLTLFNANPSIPIKLLQPYDHSTPRDAILSLVLALGLPYDDACDVVKVLLNAGAKCSQANIEGITAFQFFANHSLEMMEQLLLLDKSHSRLALNHITINGTYWYPQYMTPLRTAIENQDVPIIKKLLSLGADYEIDRNDWATAMLKKSPEYTRGRKDEDLKREFFERVPQPILLAVEHDCPFAIQVLLQAGADINTMNDVAHLRLNGLTPRGSDPGLTLLDMVRAKIDELQKGTLEESLEPLKEPAGIETLRQGVNKNSYKHWVVSRYVKEAQTDFANKLRRREDEIQRQSDDIASHKRLQHIRQVLDRFKSLEQFLLERGAKTFATLHYNDAMKLEEERLTAEYQAKIREQQDNFTQHAENRALNDSIYTFDVPNLTDSLRADYLDLFQAAWTSDLVRIHELTMTFRDGQQDRSPLEVTVKDRYGHCAFDVALMRGHVDTAIAILDIVHAQHEPYDKELSYTMANDEDENSSHDGDASDVHDYTERIQLYSRLPAATRNQFTIDNIGEIARAVKGHISSLDTLKASHPLHMFLKLGGLHSSKLVEQSDIEDLELSFFSFAMMKNDTDLFNKLVDIALQYQKRIIDADNFAGRGALYIWTLADLDTAIRLGKTEFIEIMISRTGVGISLDELIKSEGMEAPQKSRFYKGLSIRGKKNEAWAQAPHQAWSAASPSERPNLLLQACHSANLRSIDWFLSDAPLRCYISFASAYGTNAGVKVLDQAEGGFKESVAAWLMARRELIITCAVMSRYVEGESEKLISYLTALFPEYIDARSSEGCTALQLAFAYRRPTLARILIDAGACIQTTDNQGNNLMHVLFCAWRHNDGRGGLDDNEQIEATLAVLDKDIIKQMLLRRNWYKAGAKTPLQQWLSLEMGKSFDDSSLDTLRLLLRLSGGEDLQIVDGSGDTPVHSAVAKSNIVYLDLMLKQDPTCLVRENAVGRTPLEIARDNWLKERIKESPIVGKGSQYWHSPMKTKPLVQRDKEWFLNERRDEVTDVERTWTICRSLLEKNSDLKRRLVSLSEANEVAKRLADTQRTEETRNHPDLASSAERRSTIDEVQRFYVDPLQ